MSESENRVVKKKRLAVPIGIAIVVVCILVGGIVIYVKALSPDARLQKQLDLGRKYLDEMDYERAIAAFEKAIEIDPNNPEIYLELANAYIGLNDYDSASEVLDSIDDEDLTKKLQKKAKSIRTEIDKQVDYLVVDAENIDEESLIGNDADEEVHIMFENFMEGNLLVHYNPADMIGIYGPTYESEAYYDFQGLLDTILRCDYSCDYPYLGILEVSYAYSDWDNDGIVEVFIKTRDYAHDFDENIDETCLGSDQIVVLKNIENEFSVVCHASSIWTCCGYVFGKEGVYFFKENEKTWIGRLYADGRTDLLFYDTYDEYDDYFLEEFVNFYPYKCKVNAIDSYVYQHIGMHFEEMELDFIPVSDNYWESAI